MKRLLAVVAMVVLAACVPPPNKPNPQNPPCTDKLVVDGLEAAQSQPHPREWPSGWHGDGNAGLDGSWTWCKEGDDDF